MTTVLYVGGTGRSGSTVMANLLGEVEGYVSVGELRFLWQRGIGEDRLCGCGEPFSACPFWQRVLKRAFGADLPSAADLHAALTAATRLRRLPSWLAARNRSRLVPPELRDALPRLYAAVAEESGAQVVVDSSKLPTYAALLDALPDLDVRVLHLVRDPRAAAFSWRRRKAQPDKRTPALMERRGVVKSATLWTVWNGSLEGLWRGRRGRYHRTAYEALVERPLAVTDQILTTVGDGGDAAGVFTDAHTARLHPSHTVAGNPARLTYGEVAIRPDDEWRATMSTSDRTVVTTLTRPLLTRYGYPTRTAAVPASGR